MDIINHNWLYLFLGYLNLNLEKESIQQDVLFSFQSMIKKIDKRLKAIEENRLDEDVLDWVTSQDGDDKEVSILKYLPKTR